MRKRSERGRWLPSLAVAFLLGGVTGWWMHEGPPLPPSIVSHAMDGQPAEPPATILPVATSGRPAAATSPPAPTVGDKAIDSLRDRHLRIPIDGAQLAAWKGAFEERRDGRAHEAVDILAARNTPIHAVDDGTIGKLFESKAGGHTIYEFDPAGRFAYYYAHLERYAAGIKEGQAVARGDVIGYVGTSGNAPPNTPHLHFTIFELAQPRRWWEGRAIDPYLVFKP